MSRTIIFYFLGGYFSLVGLSVGKTEIETARVMDSPKATKCRFISYQDTVRGLAVMPGLGILSASHDSSIRLWALTGEALVEMVGHTSLVYCVDTHSSGLVASGSEDCFLKIWRDGTCVQSIEHPGCVWDVKFLESGDIVTACSDGTVRVWTSHNNRIAETLELEAYAEELSQYRSNRKKVGGLKLAELPGLEALQLPGSSDGQTLVVREGDNGVAYSWNSKEQKWDKVRDELEHLLDDDDDMAGMYLTQKLARQQLSMTSSSCFLQHGIDGERLPSHENIDNRNNYDIDIHSVGGHCRQLSRLSVISDDDSYEIRSCSTKGGSKHHCVEELEMLLEAYFVQIDSTLCKLSTLREYVDDTEDYINVMLDDKQNHLLQTGVMLTTATLIVSAFVVVTGIFGMNITIELYNEKKSGSREFLWTVGGGTIGTLLLYAIAIAWLKYKRLLE